ncbi:hypothetical protein [Apilactobacillus ozensis]|uniref:hypothetical protein n=1 Tax=Apilactobacillus ozensis TaxID=866801 RepID=UPI000AC01F41|nr:hypothetical protein [Apilactobacillus ozensis]
MVNAIKNDFVASTVNVSVGGGITGALLLSIFNILGSMIGSAIIALIIIAIGFMFIFNLGINDISNILNDYINKLKKQV